jgi:hypothetical protein
MDIDGQITTNIDTAPNRIDIESPAVYGWAVEFRREWSASRKPQIPDPEKRHD